MTRANENSSVLIVCTGNICRSPMAEGILRDLLRRRGLADVGVSSAGTLAMDGARASSGAAEAARENGIDIGGHRSRLLTSEIVDESDLVLVMEIAHLYETQRVAPRAKGKTFLMSQYGRPDLSEDGGDLDVADPLGGSRERYRECFREIRGHLERAMPAIEDLAGRKRTESSEEAGEEP